MMWNRAFEGLPGPAVAGLVAGLLDQAGIGVAAMDGHGRLTTLSPALARIFGDQLRPLPSAALPHALGLYTEDAARPLLPAEVPLVRARAGEVVRDAVVAVRHGGQPVRYLRCNAIPVPALDGDRCGALSVVDEAASNRSASSATPVPQRDLLEWLDHELRTPLTVLLGHAELLSPVDLPDPVGDSIAAMVRASRRLATLSDSVQEDVLRGAGADDLRCRR
jgi:signal transduction histidine kinase